MKFLLLAALAVPVASASDGPAPAEPAIQYSEVTRKVVQLADHQVTYILVRPPLLPKRPVSTPAAAPALTAEEQAANERSAAKDYESITVTGTVYLGARTVTELTWSHQGRQFRAYSNADFRYLSQLTQLETDTTVFAFFPFIFSCEIASISESERPSVLNGIVLSETEPEYLFEGTEADMAVSEVTLRALDYVHAYYQLNKEALAIAFVEREAANAARELELRENPPKPTDAVIRFWPVQSRINR